MIEATVVEVVLNDKYQSGVDWSALGLQGLGYTIRQSFTGANLQESPFFSLSYRNPNAAAGGDVSSTIKLLNRWKGGGEIPGVVRKFLSEDLLEWDDHATWYGDKFTCDWRTVVPAFKDAVESSGHNRYDEIGPNLTRLTIAGDLKVDAGKVRGVPRFLGGTIGPAIEAFLVNSIKPNLISVAKGVSEYIRANPR